VCRRAILRLKSLVASNSFRTWRENARRKRQVHVACSRIVMRMMHHTSATALEAWRARSLEQVRALVVLGLSLMECCD